MRRRLYLSIILLNLISSPVLAAPQPEISKEGLLYAVLHASIIVQLTFLILILMSIVSWGVILTKHRVFKKIHKNNLVFKNVFQQASSLHSIYDLSKKHPQSSLATIFVVGYNELKRLSQSKLAEVNSSKEGLLLGIDNLERSLNKAIDNEISFMEKYLQFLATTGTTSPFIGLFGTVFGIMDAFQQIGQSGSASLAVVAPGISEALLATGVGLFTAIPAAVFYNHYLNKMRKVELTFSNFKIDFLNIAKRNFFKDS